jgi:peptidoglycan/LPS O-acetylase OafA/YrhL
MKSLKSLIDRNQYSRNLSILRFLFATLVMYSHSFSIVQGVNAVDPFERMAGLSLGATSVCAFFIISGFLVTQSFIKNNDPQYWFASRLLRIYPALIVAVILFVFVFGLALTTDNKIQYIAEASWINYLGTNATLYTEKTINGLSGVFGNTPLSGAFNLSLWTLPFEVKMYLIFFSFFLLKIHKIRSIYLLIISTFILIHISNTIMETTLTHFNKTLIQFISYFGIGSLYYIFKDKILISKKILFSLFILVSAAYLFSIQNLFYLIFTVFLSYLIFTLSFRVKNIDLKFFENDYSYGLYIYAFPIQQTYMHIYNKYQIYYVYHLDPHEHFIASFFTTLLLAMLSWHLIEKKSLQFKRHFKRDLES